MTDFMENKLVDWLFRGQAIGITGASAAAGTGPTNLYFGLFTTAPTDSTSGTEVSGGAYQRVTYASSLGNWAGTQSTGSTIASSGNTGTTSNNAPITFPAPTANWGTVVAVGVFDALTSGNLLFWAPLSINKTINNGDAAPYYAAAAFSVQIDN